MRELDIILFSHKKKQIIILFKREKRKLSFPSLQIVVIVPLKRDIEDDTRAFLYG